MKKKKVLNILSTVIIAAIFLTGLGLLLYPSVSNLWNKQHSSRTISTYQSSVQKLDTGQEDVLYQAALAYNTYVVKNPSRFRPTPEESEIYQNTLNVSGDGMMGYLSIPGLEVALPIYHTTDENVLQSGVGHMEGSTLPIGGPGTHCVLSGHTGLASAKLLTNLDKMEIGDTFSLSILSEKLTYQVDAINVVLPDDTTNLGFEHGKDYCTLVTCTPYGLNTHRLLVRGIRIETPAEEEPGTEVTVVEKNQFIIGVCVGALLVILIVAIVLIIRHIKKRKQKGE